MDDAAVLEGGLADPVFATQAIFRAAMSAFAEPGTLVDFGAAAAPPRPLVPAAAALLAALADGDTPIWLGSCAPTDAAARWLRFHTGAPIADSADEAAFAVLLEGDDPAGWHRFARGTPDYPDRSATLLLPVRALRGGPTLDLTGPGIEQTRRIEPAGLPAGFAAALAANAAYFPLGFDLVLVCGTEAIALPRTTRVVEG